jgi:hypothetical protein
VYKIVQYGTKPLSKTSPDKQTRPGRKSIRRLGLPRLAGREAGEKLFEKDVVSSFPAQTDDLLKPFTSAEDMATIQNRLAEQLSHLPDAIKSIRNPAEYPVTFE